MISPRLRTPARLALLLAAIALGILAATEWLARPWTVSGPSMEPALRHGDRVIVDLWSYRYRSPRPGEVVLVAGPAPGSSALLKRVAQAPPGREGRDGAVWLLGDNPRQSEDSRHFGPVPAGRVRGRVCLRYWPPSRAGRIR